MPFKRRYLWLAVLAALTVLSWSIVNTPWLTRMLISRACAGMANVTVKGVQIGHQRFSLPGHLELDGIRLELKINGKLFLLQVPRALVTGLQGIFTADRRFLVNARDIQISYDAGSIQDAAVELTVARDGVIGPVTAAGLSWDKLRATDAAGFVVINAAGVELRALKFRMCDGNVTGKVLVRGGAGMAHTAEFALDGFDVAQLTDVNPQLAAQLDGRVTGNVAWQASAGALEGMDLDLGMLDGGKVSAALLSALTQYLPKSREKKRLESLITKGGKLPMEIFALTMKSAGEGKLAGEVHLRSREINLELNVTQEINTDGSLASLGAYWERFIQ